MVKIYCLVDPRTNRPFYVGITNGKLATRLSGHINEAKSYYYRPPYRHLTEVFGKHALILELLNQSRRPRIREIMTIAKITANHYESFFYNMFLLQGFILFQSNTAFKYYESKTNSRFDQPEFKKYKQLRRYNYLFFQDMLVISW